MVRVILRPFVQRLAVAQRFAASSRAVVSNSYATRALGLVASSDNLSAHRAPHCQPTSARWMSTKGGKKKDNRRRNQSDNDEMFFDDIDREMDALLDQENNEDDDEDLKDIHGSGMDKTQLEKEKRKLRELVEDDIDVLSPEEFAEIQKAQEEADKNLEPPKELTEEEKEEQELLELFLDALQQRMDQYDTDKDGDRLSVRELKQFLDEEEEDVEAQVKEVEEGTYETDEEGEEPIAFSPKLPEWTERIDNEEPSAWGVEGNDKWSEQNKELTDEEQQAMDEAEFDALFESLAKYHDIRHSEVDPLTPEQALSDLSDLESLEGGEEEENDEDVPLRVLSDLQGGVLPHQYDFVNHKKIIEKAYEQKTPREVKPVKYFLQANHPDNVELALDVELLRMFLSPTGQILPRRFTGLNAKQQRKLQRAIKVSRQLGLLPMLTRFPMPSPEQWQEIYARQQARLDAEVRAMEASGELDEDDLDDDDNYDHQYTE